MARRRGAGRWCAAVSCNKSSRKNPELSFFRFPKDDKRCRTWVQNTRRDDLLSRGNTYLYNNCVLCTLHFEDSQFMNAVQKSRLIWNAVPTLFDVPHAQPAFGVQLPSNAFVMPNGRKRKQPSLELLCEWGQCTESFDDLDKFLDHVAVHVEKFCYDEVHEDQAPDDVAERSEEATVDCRWRLCPHLMSRADVAGCERHIYFHAFHCKLKCRGTAALDDARRRSDGCNGSCLLDVSSRNTIPELPERLRCSWGDCEYVRDNSELFYRHVGSHAHEFPEGMKVDGGCACQWIGCTAVTSNRYKLSEHLRSHTQERAAACPTCGGLFANATKLIDHVRRQATVRAQSYQCSHCNKEYPTERLLRDHIRHHVNMYKCDLCDMTCPHPSGLRTHILYRHMTERVFGCPYCDFKAKIEADLQKHIETHNEAGTYACQEEGCSYVTKTSELYMRHVKCHQLQPAKKYVCHMCEETFTRGFLLTSHLKEKHKFSWPSGHKRFRYKQHNDGTWHLQTVRYESMDVGEQQAVAMQTASTAVASESSGDDEVAGECEQSVVLGSAAASAALPEEHLANLEMLHDVAVWKSLAESASPSQLSRGKRRCEKRVASGSNPSEDDPASAVA